MNHTITNTTLTTASRSSIFHWSGCGFAKAVPLKVRTFCTTKKGVLVEKCSNLEAPTLETSVSCCPHRPGARSAASIIVRGANDFMVDEMERSLHDALCVVKRVLESNQVVPGGGAVETALSIYLENFATSIVSRYSV